MAEKLLRNYVSDIDKFLQAFDKLPEATSASRKAEEEKYRKIGEARDKVSAKPQAKLWQKF